MRPSEIEKVDSNTTETPISLEVLQDVNTTIDGIRSAMSKSLKTECERLGGKWITTPYEETTSDDTNEDALEAQSSFYQETNANKKWGFCAKKDDETQDGTISQNAPIRG